MSALREILPGIFTWPWFAERFGYDFNGYLFEDVAVDPAIMTDDVLEELAGRGVSRIVLTNRNHFRDAEKLRVRTGARVAVHPADAAFVREKGVLVEDELKLGEHIGDLVVVDAAGKSPGEIALYHGVRDLLVVGDICVGNPPGKLALLSEKVMDDPARLRESLARLAKLKVESILVGDGASILENAYAALDALVASFK
jgi:glyoxylase-like metal-dependent hydrolase (beta-lactamase superfamily II)